MRYSLIFLFLFGMLLSGCSSNLTEHFDKNGLSFDYPKELKISVDDFIPYNGPIIYVEQVSISDFIKGCVEMEVERENYRSNYEAEEDYRDTIETLRSGQISEEVSRLDSLSCNSTMGNINAVMLEKNGLKGVVYKKALSQTGVGLDVFYKQIVFIDSQDMVHDIIIPYDFGDAQKSIDDIGDELSSDEAYAKGELRFEQVYKYLENNKSIVSDELKGFERNDLIIDKIIESIKIDN